MTLAYFAMNRISSVKDTSFHSEVGLNRVRDVAERLRLAPLARKVVTITGTNGKGSTAALCEAIGLAAGLKVGMFTTPHLFRYNESIRIGGRDVDDRALLGAFHRVACVSRGQDPTKVPLDIALFSNPRAVKDACLGGASETIPLHPYELLALVALLLLRDADLDLAVLEVGLGGRWDAVNVIDADAAILTSVGIDHCEYLGSDREAIGANKAGIFRPNAIAVIGETDPPDSVLAEAGRIGVRLWRNGHDFSVERGADAWRLQIGDETLVLPLPAMPAPIQTTNAAVSAIALRAIFPDLTAQAIARGVAEARAMGRLERIRRGETEVMIDVAHNPHAARALAAWIDAERRAGRVLAVFGTYDDKDVEGIACELNERVAHWYLCGLQAHNKRGLTAAAHREMMRTVVDDARMSGFDSIEGAYDAACADAGVDDLVLVFGSPPPVAVALTLRTDVAVAAGPA